MEPLTQEKIDKFLDLLGDGLSIPVNFYLLGGSALYSLGSLRKTVDLDYCIYPDSQEVRESNNVKAFL